MLLMFGTLLYFGGQIYQAAPPIPASVQSVSGQMLYTREQIERGQNLWQSMGGMQQGSIWGHGSYVAPDWSADWLHREAVALLERLARAEYGRPVAETALPDQARLQSMLRQEMRTNTYDAQTGIVTVGEARAQAVAFVGAHFRDLFGASTDRAQTLRGQYAFPVQSRFAPDEADAVSAFFFWTAWAATTNRPGQDITYTSNWPHEPLVGNAPSGAVFMWTFISIFVLLGGIGLLVWYYAKEF